MLIEANFCFQRFRWNVVTTDDGVYDKYLLVFRPLHVKGVVLLLLCKTFEGLFFVPKLAEINLEAYLWGFRTKIGLFYTKAGLFVLFLH